MYYAFLGALDIPAGIAHDVLELSNITGYIGPNGLLFFQTPDLSLLRQIHNIYYKKGKLTLADKAQASILSDEIVDNTTIKGAAKAFIQLIANRIKANESSPYPAVFSISGGKITVAVTIPADLPPPVITETPGIPPVLPDTTGIPAYEFDPNVPSTPTSTGTPLTDTQALINKWLPYGLLLFGAVIALNMVNKK